MKTFLVLCMAIFVSGCMPNWHQKPEKFQLFPEVMKTFSSETSISVITPKNNPEMLIENLNFWTGKGANFYYDMDELYKIAGEYITETLKNNYVPVSSEAAKYIKFTVTKMQWETWGAVMYVQGCYLYVTVETSSGYKRDFRAQDQSGWHIDRAVSGAIARAVEMIFQDSKIIAFIES